MLSTPIPPAAQWVSHKDRVVLRIVQPLLVLTLVERLEEAVVLLAVEPRWAAVTP